MPPSTPDDPSLTPEQEREVRRLLADARLAEPMPGDVAARLDRVLAELAQGGAEPSTPVTVLASRRRKRVVSILVAAAAVVVVGIGLGQVVGTRSGDADTAASAGSQVTNDDRAELAKPQDQLQSSPGDAGGSSATAPLSNGSAAAPPYALNHAVTVHPEHFSHDANRLRRLVGASRAPKGNGPAADQLNRLSSFTLECPPADWGEGTFVPVTYDGDPGVLVFRAAIGDTQVVDLFRCGSPDAIRSITLPAR